MENSLSGKYPLQTMSDTVFEYLCLQVSADYTSIIRNYILPESSNEGEIGVREVRVLLLVDLLDGAVSSSKIAEYLRFDPGTVTRAAKRLVDVGYVERKKIEGDRRTLYFEITRSGATQVEKYRTHIQEKYAQLDGESVETLNDEERKTIFRALMKLRNRSEALVKADQKARGLVAALD